MPIRPWRNTQEHYLKVDNQPNDFDRLWRALDRILSARCENDISMGGKSTATGTPYDMMLADEKERRYTVKIF